MTFSRTLAAFCLALFLTILCPAITYALDPYGGLGGQDFRDDCPKGAYLVGLTGRIGSWVDRIAPICASWQRASQSLVAPSIGPSFGMSPGGEERLASCMNMSSGGHRHAIQSWWIRLLRSDNHYVQSIQFYCTSLTAAVSANSGWRLNFGTFSLPPDAEEMVTQEGPFPSRPPFQACPGGEVAVGIRVRAGQFVHAVGLICGPVPTGVPTTNLDPRVLNPGMPTPDMFVITKPLAGEKIPHGHLFVFAAPPKVGGTDVVELELKYLDAPANQRNSYPYTTVFSVTKVQLLDGYPVTEQVTGGYVGRWQVRARSSMKAVPGPWSVPVQFQMVKAQAPPVMQMPRSNAPITQTPMPKAGTTPLMIRPRGTDEKLGREENKEAGGSAEAERSP